MSANSVNTEYLNATGLSHLISELKTGSFTESNNVVTASHFVVGAARQVLSSGIVGTIPIANLPHGSLERAVSVSTKADMYNLTVAQVQAGDTVIVQQGEAYQATENGQTVTRYKATMYYVVDESQLSTAAGYMEYSSGTATHALSADNAEQATYAISAGSASHADSATSATSATEAGKLAASITLTLAGAVSGSHAFDGSANFTINTTLANIASNKVTALTGYTERTTAPTDGLLTTDSLNSALAKLSWYVSKAFNQFVVTVPDGNSTQDVTIAGGNGQNQYQSLEFGYAGATTLSVTDNKITISSTDQKVQQVPTSSNATHALVMSYQALANVGTGVTNSVNIPTNLFYNPSTKQMIVGANSTSAGSYGTVYANLKGGKADEAVKATQDKNGDPIDETYVKVSDLGDIQIGTISNNTIDQMIAGTWVES